MKRSKKPNAEISRVSSIIDTADADDTNVEPEMDETTEQVLMNEIQEEKEDEMQDIVEIVADEVKFCEDTFCRSVTTHRGKSGEKRISFAPAFVYGNKGKCPQYNGKNPSGSPSELLKEFGPDEIIGTFVNITFAHSESAHGRVFSVKFDQAILHQFVGLILCFGTIELSERRSV